MTNGVVNERSNSVANAVLYQLGYSNAHRRWHFGLSTAYQINVFERVGVCRDLTVCHCTHRRIVAVGYGKQRIKLEIFRVGRLLPGNLACGDCYL